MERREFRTEAEQQNIFNRRAGRLSRRLWGRRLINIFIVFHIAALALWLLPYQWPLVQSQVPDGRGGWVRAYLVTTGFQQSWQMFSPNPDTRDIDIEALVTYRNGETRSWRFPRMRTLGYGARYRRERMRKFLEIANYNSLLWPSLARYAAQVCRKNPQNPPVLVTLVRYSRDIPPPGYPLSPYRRQEFYKGTIHAEDLR